MAHHNETEDFVMVDKADADEPSSHPDHLKLIDEEVEHLSSSLRAISIDIHDHPELQYKEVHAHRVLTEYLKKQDGWHVIPSAYGTDTAFVASCDSGKKGPTVSFNAEYGTRSVFVR